MPLFKGSTEVVSVAKGATPLTSIYKGTVPIWNANSTQVVQTYTETLVSVPQLGPTTGLTFSAVPIGDAFALRRVLFIYSQYLYSTQFHVPTATIGGIAATMHVNQRVNNFGGSLNLLMIGSALVPTGTTADVVVGWTDNVNRGGHGFTAFAIDNLNTVSDLQNVSGTTSPQNITQPSITSFTKSACFCGSMSRNLTGSLGLVSTAGPAINKPIDNVDVQTTELVTHMWYEAFQPAAAGAQNITFSTTAQQVLSSFILTE